ncbi:hypothetical protein ACFXBB_36305 [Streptomyces scopuliridis]|uniref:hypothetical protein n=1 Tax=Streptomyces scopuliridis TaxID=452529 RepID=UPI0036764EF9
MGRPDKPVNRTVPARAALAVFLRARKDNAHMTYQEMAERVGHRPSAATFKRAAAGATVPAWATVHAFVKATVTEEELFNGENDLPRSCAWELWLRARRATRAEHYVHKAPDPELITNKTDLSGALRDLHAWAGAPSPREMEAAAGQHGELPHTTAHRIIKGKILPVSRRQTVAYLRACYLDRTEIRRWIDSFIRIGFIDNTGLFFWKTELHDSAERAQFQSAA